MTTRKAGPKDSANSESEAFLAAEARAELVHEVNECLSLFAASQNGLYLWRAYEACRRAGEPPPEVILQGFDRIAQRLGAANTEAEVSAALWLEGRGQGGGPRVHLARVERQFHIASAVEAARRRGVSWRAACGLVGARLNMSAAQVAEVSKKWKRGELLRDTAKRAPAAPIGPRSVFDWVPRDGE